MTYFKKISSLKEKALYQVAINLCQDTSFKEVAMCLEKPTYGLFLYNRGYQYFIGGPKILLVLSKMEEAKMKKDYPLADSLRKTLYDQSKVELWDTAVEEQCQWLTEKLPNSLKHEIHVWINRIAFEYLSYSRRQELLFGVSRYFLMNFLIRSDWTEDARLNEMKVAKRLLKDERLTIMQRYRIACVYCLHINIPQLWSRLTQEEKLSIKRDDDPYYQENESLVLLWSEYMKGYAHEKVKWQRKDLWVCAAQLSLLYGNQMAFMLCWKRLNQRTRRQLLIYKALQALKKWKSAQSSDKWRYKLVSNIYYKPRNRKRRPDPLKHFNLPSYYSELMRFLLSKMSKRQKLAFFDAAFENGGNWNITIKYDYICVLECFLDWPLRDYFLSTINLLWGIISKDKYALCLLSLACRVRGEYEVYYYYPESVCEKEKHYYDYQSMLLDLWEETPEEYKQYVLCDKKHSRQHDSFITVIMVLFLELLKKDPFQKRDSALFKRFWCDIPQQEKKAIICCNIGKNIFFQLFEKEQLSFVNWLLEESLTNVEIPNFKEEFMKSEQLQSICCGKLNENYEKYVEKLINWSFESDSDKIQFKSELINNEHHGLCLCSYLLNNGDFAKVERIINFCLSSDEMKTQFQLNVVKKSCCALFKDCSLEQIDKILAWNFKTEVEITDFKKDVFNLNVVKSNCYALLENCLLEQIDKILAWKFKTEEKTTDFKQDVFNVNIVKSTCCALLKSYLLEQIDKILKWNFETEEEIKNFKKDLFNSDGFNTHYNLVFIKKEFKNVQCFYEFFCLSSEEIIKIQKETVFAPNVMENVRRALCSYEEVNRIFPSLRLCLTNEEMVISFRKELEKRYFQGVKKNRVKLAAKSQLGSLVRNLLQEFKEPIRETTFFKDKGEKRSLVIEDDQSNSVPSYKHLKVNF